MGAYKISILFNGYSTTTDHGSLANCTCSLIKGPKNIIVDTMTAWDGPKIKEALQQHNINCEDIDWVICTHGHSDHVGCNYLFQNAKHVVGHCISHKDKYYDHDFNEKFVIDDDISIIATPGHTMQDVSVVVRTEDMGIVVVAGDLFEREEDLQDDTIWKSAGSDSELQQFENRNKMLKIANWIIPGHGPMFKITGFKEI